MYKRAVYIIKHKYSHAFLYDRLFLYKPCWIVSGCLFKQRYWIQWSDRLVICVGWETFTRASKWFLSCSCTSFPTCTNDWPPNVNWLCKFQVPMRAIRKVLAYSCIAKSLYTQLELSDPISCVFSSVQDSHIAQARKVQLIVPNTNQIAFYYMRWITCTRVCKITCSFLHNIFLLKQTNILERFVCTDCWWVWL